MDSKSKRPFVLSFLMKSGNLRNFTAFVILGLFLELFVRVWIITLYLNHFISWTTTYTTDRCSVGVQLCHNGGSINYVLASNLNSFEVEFINYEVGVIDLRGARLQLQHSKI